MSWPGTYDLGSVEAREAPINRVVLTSANRALANVETVDPGRILLDVDETEKFAVVPSDSLEESARSYARDSRARRTLTEYAKDWSRFASWCGEAGLPVLPASPRTVALYLTARADQGRKVATIQGDLAAISEAHRAAGHDSPRQHPIVRAVLKGIRRRLGVAAPAEGPRSSWRTSSASWRPSRTH